VLLSLLWALDSTYSNLTGKETPSGRNLRCAVKRGQIYSRDKEKIGRQWKEAVMLNELNPLS